MSRDHTDVEHEYLNLDFKCGKLRKHVAEMLAGAIEGGFSSETRNECTRRAKAGDRLLKRFEKQMLRLKPQFELDRAKRHARDLEEAAEYKRKQQKMKL